MLDAQNFRQSRCTMSRPVFMGRMFYPSVVEDRPLLNA